MSGDKREFEKLGKAGRGNLLTEFFEFLQHNKKWWLLPLILVILLLGTLVLLGGTALGPFIYTLF